MVKTTRVHHYSLLGIFIFLLLILAIQPSILKNMYGSILGRIVLILLVLFVSMNNITLGLLIALIIIIASNMYFTEGLDNMSTSTTTTTNPLSSTSTTTQSGGLLATIENKKAQNATTTTTTLNTDSTSTDDSPSVDLETIKASLQPKASSTLPATPPTSTENVAPSTTESFKSMYESF